MAHEEFVDSIIPARITMMMELDGEIGSGDWYPVINGEFDTFVPHRLGNGSVAWRKMRTK